jgi:hypothetical protein
MVAGFVGVIFFVFCSTVLMLSKLARKKIALLNVALILWIDVFDFRFLRTRPILLFNIQN